MVQSLVLDTRISFFAAFTVYAVRSIWSFLKILRIGKKRGQRRSSVAGLTEDDRQTVDKERQVGDPMQLRTEVLNL